MISIDNFSEFEVTEKGFDFLFPKIDSIPALNLTHVKTREVPIIKKDLWGKEEIVSVQKYFVVKIDGLDSLDDRTLGKVEIYVNGSQGEEWNEEYEAGINKKHLKTDTLLKYVVLAYIAQGKFVTKNKSDESTLPTIDDATQSMLDMSNKTWVHKKLRLNVVLRQDAEILLAKLNHWLKKMDFVEFSKLTPDWEDYFRRLNEVSHSDTIDIKKANYVGGLLQTYLRFEKEKIKEEKGVRYTGTIGMTDSFRGEVIISKPLSGVRNFKAHLYIFQDLSGNIIKWVTSKKDGVDEGMIFNVSGKVKSHQVDTFTKQPTTTITHGILEKI